MTTEAKKNSTNAPIRALKYVGNAMPERGMTDQIVSYAMGQLLSQWWIHGGSIPVIKGNGQLSATETWHLWLNEVCFRDGTRCYFDLREELLRCLKAKGRHTIIPGVLFLVPDRTKDVAGSACAPNTYARFQDIGCDIKAWWDDEARENTMVVHRMIGERVDTITLELRSTLHNHLSAFTRALNAGWVLPKYPGLNE